ncbi:hypothetical protein UR09_04650 [Candidatus Nitromaritima sp. SCGC AAA799-A02]|nr:hypothetical protein UR09_04650 [Candidatus Nitromaritima sp. SCGC AAA799-A02]
MGKPAGFSEIVATGFRKYMKPSNFVHLHLHTSYSLLDSSLRHDALFKRAVEYKMPAVAMTDHGNMFGAVEFYNGAKKHGLKPIIGCEVYVAPESRHEKTSKHELRDASYHLILLAQDETGYRNLLKLVTAGYLEGFYYKPRIDKELLAEHAEGLIALSSCGRGEIAHNVNKENIPRAVKIADQYRDIMGQGNFFLELQYHKMEYQEKINQEIIKIAEKLSLPLVATNNCHYLERQDFHAHEILLCLQTGKTISDQYRMRYPSDEYYFKSPEEMMRIFREVPEAIENTVKIAERCDLNIDFDRLNLPEYPVPEGYTLESYLVDHAKEGLEERFQEMARHGVDHDKDLYRERLQVELDIIERMGYLGYFLIVWDFIDYARKSHHKMIKTMRSGEHVGGAFGLTIESDKLFLKLISALATWRAKYLNLVYGDQAIFVRATVFRELGGFSPLPICEDLDFFRRLSRRGKVVLLEEKALTSGRRWRKEGILFTTLRNIAIATLFLLGFPPRILTKWYLVIR